jgi:2-methylaconitate cis-trans-isomerase PrpF
MQMKIPCVVMRGGTSRGLIFKEEDLPEDQQVRDQVLMAAFGSPDPNKRQIDGMGGATSTTNKVVIVSRRKGEPNTVNYTIGQISVTDPFIDYKGNCGNMASAVGPFAIDEGLVDHVEEPYTTVRIYNTNTNKYMISRTPVENGKAKVEGDFPSLTDDLG